jgi:nucleotide-binding universal stress UspA family protein
MFKHVLVAIDGSPHSQLVLPAAIELARKFDSDVRVVHVSEHDRGRAVAFTLESPASASMLVADAVRTVRQSGIEAIGQLCEVAAGHVAKAIVEEAEANGIDLIVMGSRGLSDVQGLLLGSVTHQVMKSSTAPVLVVKPALKASPASSASIASF